VSFNYWVENTSNIDFLTEVFEKDTFMPERSKFNSFVN